MSSQDAATLHARAAELLDTYPKNFKQAKELLRQVLALEPDHLEALHDLNWSLDRDRDLEPGRWQKEEQSAQALLRERILALTRNVKPGEPLTLERKARSLALAHHAEALLQSPPDTARLQQVEAALAESQALRPEGPEQGRAERGVMAWKAIHRARNGEPQAYQALLDWVAEHPRPSPFHDDEHACAFRGLEQAFADEGFLAWLRAQEPRSAKDALARQLLLGLEHVVDWDTFAFLNGPVSTPCRVGRLLALRALGGDLSVKVQGQSLLEHAKRLGDAALVKELEALASPAPEAKTQAAPVDRSTVALSFTDLHVTDAGHVVVLGGTPHPSSDYGAVSGDDLWDFDESIPWNQPWSDQVWLSQVTVDEDEVDPFEPSYEVDCNRLLIHDGKTWERHRLPRALPYGYVAPTLRDLGTPWGLTGFGVSALAFAGAAGASGEWTVQEVTGATALNLVDGVVHEGTLFALCETNGLGRITSSRFERIQTEQQGFRGLRSLAGTLFVLGEDGLWALDGDTLVARCSTEEPVLDVESHPGGGLILRTESQALVLPDGGEATALELPEGRVHSLAVFQGQVFVSVRDQVFRVEGTRAVPLEVPTPAPGFPRLKAAGGRLWAVFPHHLASSSDGKTFEAVTFR
ncbi:hypothetical protein NR800_24725 [Corallococcus interemptor]|uniref:hypothetical protein n=1 Tax=Corallococcus TaxID=83461 RepID=UPI001CBFE997|nr:hypothetical protein [Corallococcus sp. AS-1-12]MBZ4332291.1 hypothetical protein [Corallococcus sp. AS-1-12]